MRNPPQVFDSVIMRIGIDMINAWFVFWIWNERLGDEPVDTKWLNVSIFRKIDI